jgi:fructose-bisphosphate aldolase class I
MMAPGKGILAADESIATMSNRLEEAGAEPTAENRRRYRELLAAAPGLSESISGIIFCDETLRQTFSDGTPFAHAVRNLGMLPGIKVDTGAKACPGLAGETVTEGLDGLRERLKDYHGLGARFAKWRAVIDIGERKPSYAAILANAHALARYAALCQEADIVPIVEPEVLMDGGHDIQTCAQVTEWALKEVYQQLYHQNVVLEGTVLKPNMIVPGNKSGKRASVDEVAERTIEVLKRCVPSAVPGIAFLSGGQSDEEATAHLNAMNRIGGLPWKLTFSYGRALQAAPQKAWSGRNENVAAAQRAFSHRAKMNGLAALGQWQNELEKKVA